MIVHLSKSQLIAAVVAFISILVNCYQPHIFWVEMALTGAVSWLTTGIFVQYYFRHEANWYVIQRTPDEEYEDE